MANWYKWLFGSSETWPVFPEVPERRVALSSPRQRCECIFGSDQTNYTRDFDSFCKKRRTHPSRRRRAYSIYLSNVQWVLHSRFRGILSPDRCIWMPLIHPHQRSHPNESGETCSQLILLSDIFQRDLSCPNLEGRKLKLNLTRPYSKLSWLEISKAQFPLHIHRIHQLNLLNKNLMLSLILEIWLEMLGVEPLDVAFLLPRPDDGGVVGADAVDKAWVFPSGPGRLTFAAFQWWESMTGSSLQDWWLIFLTLDIFSQLLTTPGAHNLVLEDKLLQRRGWRADDGEKYRIRGLE